MKNRMNFRLLNLLMLAALIYIIYLLRDLGNMVWVRAILILKPFIIGFAIAYAIYPFLKFLERKKIPKSIGVLFILIIIASFITLIILSIVPIITNQFVSLFSNIMKFITNVDNVFDIDLTGIKMSIAKSFNSITSDIGKYISDGALNFVNASINFVSNFVITVVTFIYFLFDMDKIRENVRSFFQKKNKKTFKLMKDIDTEVTQYFKGVSLCMIIQFFEYTTIFYLIGHPNFLLLGILASLATVIPYFGGIITNIIAVAAASVVSPQLLILTLLVAFICPNIDGYVINPRVYGKTNQLSPLLSIFAVFAGGVLDGFVGILIALPLTIILLTLFRNYKKDIFKKIDNIKEKI